MTVSTHPVTDTGTPVAAARRPGAGTTVRSAVGSIARHSELVLLVSAIVLLTLSLCAVVPFWLGAPVDFLPLVVLASALTPTLVMWVVHSLLGAPGGFWSLAAVRTRPRALFTGLLTTTVVLLVVTGLPVFLNAVADWQPFAPTPGALAVLAAFPVALLMMSVQVAGEEIGWRGYAHSVLRPLGFWPATVIIGVFWVVWHVPLLTTYIHLELMDARAVMATLGNLLLAAVVLSAVRERSGSVWPAVLAHALMNTLLVYVQSNLVSPSTGLSTEAFWLTTIVGWTVWALCGAALVGAAGRRYRLGGGSLLVRRHTTGN